MIRVPYWLAMTLYWITAIGIFLVSLQLFGVWHPLWTLAVLFITFGLPKVWWRLFSVRGRSDNEDIE